MKKGQGPKHKATPEELAEKYRVNVGHAVTRIMEWNKKLQKMVTSKKYHLSEEDTGNIKNVIFSTYNDTMASFEAKVAPEKPVFKL